MLNAQITVGTNTYDCINDWECYPTRFSIGIAEPNIEKVNVPYSSGALYLANLAGEFPTYKNREISLPMLIVGEHPQLIYSAINNQINGKKIKLTLSDDEDYYWEGYARVGTLTSHGWQWDFVLYVDAYPYKYELEEQNIEMSATQSYGRYFECGDMPVVPTFTLNTGDAGIRFNGKYHRMSTVGATYKFPDIVFQKDSNYLSLQKYGSTGTTITVTYRNGRL